MDFFETVNRRGSYRGPYTADQIPEADLRRILDAAIKAPSGYNLQTTSFIVVTDEKLRRQISEWMPSEATKSAPVILVVASEHVEADGLSFEIEDYASATETMLLAITALGYAAVWMDGDTKTDDNFKRIGKLLNLPPEKTVRTIVPVGVPAGEVRQNSRRAFDERVSWNKG
ncbi:MAG: nitroreductase family protein [Anaerovoracaceae bacterium]|jgi:nitroreductase